MKNMRPRDPRDRLPRSGDPLPSYNLTVIVATYLPSLSPEKRKAIANRLRGSWPTTAAFRAAALAEAPEAFDVDEERSV